MKKLPLLMMLAAAALLAACGSKDKVAEQATPATASPTVPPPGESASVMPTPDQVKLAAAAGQESAGEETDASDASLERLAALPESAQLPGGKWKAGTHYLPIVPAQSTSAEPGQVEVLEFFWLGCPHCAALEPFIASWRKSKPAYVKFVAEHIMWGPAHRSHARFYYTLDVLGKADTLVPKAFAEIHQRNNMLVANDDAQSQRLQLAFAVANGVSEADFKREYNGFAVNTRLQRAEELGRRYKVESVPLIIVNGKYQTSESMAGGHEQLIQLINDLAAAEKNH